MNEKIDRKPVCGCKFYGVFAVNRQDPTDILGYVEDSFSMEWSKRFVSVEPGYKTYAVEKAMRAWRRDFCEAGKAGSLSGEKFLEWYRGSYENKYVEGMTEQDARAEYERTTRKLEEKIKLAQNVWNRNSDRLWVPAGYDVKVFRLSSKKCPVDADLRYRLAVNRRWTQDWDKWKYRNAAFIAKASNPGKTVFDVYPTVKSVLDANRAYAHFDKGSLVRYIRPNVSSVNRKAWIKECIGIPAELKMSRSEKKILKKQRKNSFAAKERAQGGQALPNGQG